MPRRTDVVTGVLAVGLHIVLAATLIEAPVAAPARPRPIEVEFRPPAPEQPVPPPPPQAQPTPPAPKPRPVRRKLALVTEPRRVAEAPAEPTPEPRPEPRTRAALPPVFGIAMDSPTSASSSLALPLGGTTAANPASLSRRSTSPGGSPSGGSPTGSADGSPVSELQIKTMPEIDTDACGRSVTYPDEAKRNGIQGKVRLRVTLTAHGRVSSARVLSGLGYGLDQAAVEALTRRCRFTPAIAHDGRPVPFVVESYTFNFELPR